MPFAYVLTAAKSLFIPTSGRPPSSGIVRNQFLAPIACDISHKKGRVSRASYIKVWAVVLGSWSTRRRSQLDSSFLAKLESWPLTVGTIPNQTKPN